MEDKNKETLLQEELQAYEARKIDLLKTSRNHYVVFKGSELIGTYTTFEVAYEEAVSKFGREPFLIKKIEADDQAPSMPALSYGFVGR